MLTTHTVLLFATNKQMQTSSTSAPHGLQDTMVTEDTDLPRAVCCIVTLITLVLHCFRVSPHTYLNELRSEIVEQLGDEYLPKDYTFLKSVGRCLTQVSTI